MLLLPDLLLFSSSELCLLLSLDGLQVLEAKSDILLDILIQPRERIGGEASQAPRKVKIVRHFRGDPWISDQAS